MRGVGTLLLAGIVALLSMPLIALTAAGTVVHDEHHYDYSGHNYDWYQLDFLEGDRININYTMNATCTINVYFMNRSSFQLYKVRVGTPGWTTGPETYISNMTDLKTTCTRISGSLVVRDSYFFVFEYEFVDTHLDFAVDYEIKYGRGNNNAPASTITLQYEFVIGLAAGSIVGAALAISYIALKRKKTHMTEKEYTKSAKVETSADHERSKSVQPVESYTPTPYVAPVMNGPRKEINGKPITIMIKDSVISRSFTDMEIHKLIEDDVNDRK